MVLIVITLSIAHVETIWISRLGKLFRVFLKRMVVVGQVSELFNHVAEG